MSELVSAPMHDDPNYLVASYRVRTIFLPPPSGAYRSVGVPTWFYGHERPNVFATYLAKYFENSVREEGLLAIASRGIIFAEGTRERCRSFFRARVRSTTARIGPPRRR